MANAAYWHILAHTGCDIVYHTCIRRCTSSRGLDSNDLYDLYYSSGLAQLHRSWCIAHHARCNYACLETIFQDVCTAAAAYGLGAPEQRFSIGIGGLCFLSVVPRASEPTSCCGSVFAASWLYLTEQGLLWCVCRCFEYDTVITTCDIFCCQQQYFQATTVA